MSINKVNHITALLKTFLSEAGTCEIVNGVTIPVTLCCHFLDSH